MIKREPCPQFLRPEGTLAGPLPFCGIHTAIDGRAAFKAGNSGQGCDKSTSASTKKWPFSVVCNGSRGKGGPQIPAIHKEKEAKQGSIAHNTVNNQHSTRTKPTQVNNNNK